MRLFITTSCWILFNTLSFAQYEIDIEYVDSQNSSGLKAHLQIGSEKTPQEELTEYVNELRSRGYLLANLDQLECQDKSCQAEIYLGELHRWTSVDFRSVPTDYLKKARVRASDYKEKPVDLTVFQSDLKRIQEVAANDGYPTAEIITDSLRFVDGWVDMKVNFSSGLAYEYDTLLIDEEIVKSDYLAAFLSISRGKQYHQIEVDRISQKINQTGYLTLDTIPEVSFTGGKTSI